MVDLAAACWKGAALTPVSRSSYRLHGGLRVALVSRQHELRPALELLSAQANAGAILFQNESVPYPSFQRSVHVGIDLEWRPDFERGEDNRVALMQLAAGNQCVLVRTCTVGLPSTLRAFLHDPRYTFVGLGWGLNARKMQSSFGWATEDFGSFADLAQAGPQLGLGPSPGLAALSMELLGAHVPKSKSQGMSNWERATLTRDQIRYAALDAALVWHIYRQLLLRS